jgi:hypothetical protein
MMKAVALAAVALFMGCTGGYRPPIQNPTTFIFDIAGTREALLDKAVQVLTSLDYAVESKNPNEGVLITVPRETRFTIEECDCGSYYDKPFTSDPGSSVKIQLNIAIDNGVVEFNTKFTGIHKNAQGRMDRRLECVSTGAYERQIAGFIAGKRLN